MGKLYRLIKFLLFFIPCSIMDGIRRILFDDVEIDEIFFSVIKVKPKKKKVSKNLKQKIVKEYLDDCLSKRIDYKGWNICWFYNIILYNIYVA